MNKKPHGYVTDDELYEMMVQQNERTRMQNWRQSSVVTKFLIVFFLLVIVLAIASFFIGCKTIDDTVPYHDDTPDVADNTYWTDDWPRPTW